MADIKVSIICITYNHEKYVKKAIDSFLSQKTNFSYEIIIHDDASSDSTSDIIRRYSKKYSDLIVPILQKDNKHSQEIDFLEEYVLPRIRGKYIALCEGDDYWIDDNKLQRQFDYMEREENCSLCFHNAVIVDRSDRIIKRFFLPSSELRSIYYKDKESDYTTDEMICLEFVPTNSLFFRTTHYREYKKYLHDKKYVCEDLPVRLFMSHKGISHYFPEKMSAYRSGVENSASARAFNSTPIQAFSTLVGHYRIYDDFNFITDGKYKEAIEQSKKILLFYHYLPIGNRSLFKWKVFKKMYKKLTIKHKFSFYLQGHFPVLFKSLIYLRTRYRGR